MEDKKIKVNVLGNDYELEKLHLNVDDTHLSIGAKKAGEGHLVLELTRENRGKDYAVISIKLNNLKRIN